MFMGYDLLSIIKNSVHGKEFGTEVPAPWNDVLNFGLSETSQDVSHLKCWI